jgi:MFS family permease
MIGLFTGKIISDPIWGLLRDYIGDKKSIIICICLNLGSTILFSYANTLVKVTLGSFCFGLV